MISSEKTRCKCAPILKSRKRNCLVALLSPNQKGNATAFVASAPSEQQRMLRSIVDTFAKVQDPKAINSLVQFLSENDTEYNKKMLTFLLQLDEADVISFVLLDLRKEMNRSQFDSLIIFTSEKEKDTIINETIHMTTEERRMIFDECYKFELTMKDLCSCFKEYPSYRKKYCQVCSWRKRAENILAVQTKYCNESSIPSIARRKANEWKSLQPPSDNELFEIDFEGTSGDSGEIIHVAFSKFAQRYVCADTQDKTLHVDISSLCESCLKVIYAFMCSSTKELTKKSYYGEDIKYQNLPICTVEKLRSIETKKSKWWQHEKDRRERDKIKDVIHRVKLKEFQRNKAGSFSRKENQQHKELTGCNEIVKTANSAKESKMKQEEGTLIKRAMQYDCKWQLFYKNCNKERSVHEHLYCLLQCEHEFTFLCSNNLWITKRQTLLSFESASSTTKSIDIPLLYDNNIPRNKMDATVVFGGNSKGENTSTRLQQHREEREKYWRYFYENCIQEYNHTFQSIYSKKVRRDESLKEEMTAKWRKDITIWMTAVLKQEERIRKLREEESIRMERMREEREEQKRKRIAAKLKAEKERLYRLCEEEKLEEERKNAKKRERKREIAEMKRMGSEEWEQCAAGDTFWGLIKLEELRRRAEQLREKAEEILIRERRAMMVAVREVRLDTGERMKDIARVLGLPHDIFA